MYYTMQFPGTSELIHMLFITYSILFILIMIDW